MASSANPASHAAQLKDVCVRLNALFEHESPCIGAPFCDIAHRKPVSQLASASWTSVRLSSYAPDTSVYAQTHPPPQELTV